MSISEGIISGFSDIIQSIAQDLSVLWIIIPIIATWIIVITYFGRFKMEQPGWRAFLQNSVALLWIAFDSIRFIFIGENVAQVWLRFAILLFVLLYALMLVYFSFTHTSPPWLRHLARPTPMYFLALISVLWSNGNLAITLWVAIDLLILLVIAIIISYLIWKFTPQSLVEIQEELDKYKKEEPPKK